MLLKYDSPSSKTLFFHIWHHLLQFSKRETHIHDISNTYISFPQLFAKGKSQQSGGIAIDLDNYKGQHGKFN
jgi:Fe2+ transport system protein B